MGLDQDDKVSIRYGDGDFVERSQAAVSLEACGRVGVFMALIEPNVPKALVGYTIIADLDLVVDFEQLLVVPRDPRGEMYQIE